MLETNGKTVYVRSIYKGKSNSISVNIPYKLAQLLKITSTDSIIIQLVDYDKLVLRKLNLEDY